MFNSPDGWNFGQMQAKWCCSFGPGPYICDPSMPLISAPRAYADLYEQAYGIWQAPNHSKNDALPLELMGLSTEELTEAKTIMTDIKTLREETCYKFLLGDMEVNDANIEQFVSQLEKIGIGRVLEIYQKAYDKRK